MTSGPPRYSMYPLVSCLTLRSLFPYTTLFRSALVQLHDRSPFPNTPQEIAELAAQVKDANFRIEIAEDGIHVYNRRSEEHTSELQSLRHLVCRLLLETKKHYHKTYQIGMANKC